MFMVCLHKTFHSRVVQFPKQQVRADDVELKVIHTGNFCACFQRHVDCYVILWGGFACDNMYWIDTSFSETRCDLG